MPSRPRSDAKLQRWIDLLALLLTHHYGLTLEEIKQRGPGYAAAAGKGTDDASVSRTFERDKDDLRALGVPIDTRILADGEEVRYRIEPREMYLPYLSLAAAGAKRRVPKEGYRAIPALVLEPEELDAVLRGAQLAENVGDPLLKAQAESAVRKLTFDLPIGSALEHKAGSESALVRHDGTDGAHLRELGSALLRLKRVNFTYRAIGSDRTAQRTIEPYGLFFQSGHWYLAGRDVDRNAIRNFRVSRMSGVKANSSKMQSTDYEIPRKFRLAEHARSRQAWELGDGDGEEMVLEFLGKSGAVRAAAALGDPVRGAARQRKFYVRRLDVFARWVLSFGGEVAPVSPPALVGRYRELAADTLALYRDSERPGLGIRDWGLGEAPKSERGDE